MLQEISPAMVNAGAMALEPKPQKKERTYDVFDILATKGARTHTFRDEYGQLQDFTFADNRTATKVPESVVLSCGLISNNGFCIKDERGLILRASAAMSKTHALQADQRIVYLHECEYQALKRFAQEADAPPQVATGKKEEIVRWLIEQNNKRIAVEERVKTLGENRTLSDIKDELSGVQLPGEVIEVN